MKKGVKQGDSFSPVLLSTACLEVFEHLGREGKGIKIYWEYVSNLRFAGNIMPFGSDGNQLQQIIDEVKQ